MEQENDLSGNPIVKFSTFLCESSETCNIDDFEDKDLTNPVIILSRSLLPSTNKFDGDRFFTMEDGIKKATPLFVCMIAVELSDVVFAVDSIPAVFGVTEVSQLETLWISLLVVKWRIRNSTTRCCIYI